MEILEEHMSCPLCEASWGFCRAERKKKSQVLKGRQEATSSEPRKQGAGDPVPLEMSVGSASRARSLVGPGGSAIFTFIFSTTSESLVKGGVESSPEGSVKQSNVLAKLHK